MDTLFDCLSKIRAELIQQNVRQLNAQHIAALEKSLRASKDLACREELLVQLQEYNRDSKNIFKSSTQPYIVAAFFEVPYAPEPLGLEFFEYEKIDVPKEITQQFFSIAISANIQRSSPGLQPESMVALFPENWSFKKNKLQLEPEDEAYYFNNRFVDRFFKYTRPMIQQFTTPSAFSSLRSLSATEVEKLSALWTWMHEHDHHSGPLPLPQYLSYKNSKSAGAFEELRVDMGAMANLNKLSWMNEAQKKTAMEFILAERLLRYPIERPPQDNYDAIGSQMLFHFLEQHGYLRIQNHRLHLEDDWLEGISDFSKELRQCELEASGMNSVDGKKHLSQFAKGLGNFSQEKNQYELLNFYAHCRNALT